MWLRTLDELLSLADGLLAGTPCRHLAAARTRVAEDRFNLVVLGEFKRGKSTLINALLDRDVLPTGVLPLTSVVTTIGAGERDRLSIFFQDGHQKERPLGELVEYVTEARNPGNRRGVELARVELDHELLQAGIELVDTPGIGSIHSHNTEVARGFLPRVDAALCVLDAGQPLSEAECDLLREAADRVPRLLLVINKIDHLDHADRGVAVEFVRSALRELLGDLDEELFAISARRRQGLSPLQARLRRLAVEERHTLLLRSVGTASREHGDANRAGGAVRVPRDRAAPPSVGVARRDVRAADRRAEGSKHRGRRPARPGNRPGAAAGRQRPARTVRATRGGPPARRAAHPRERSRQDGTARTVGRP